MEVLLSEASQIQLSVNIGILVCIFLFLVSWQIGVCYYKRFLYVIITSFSILFVSLSLGSLWEDKIEKEWCDKANLYTEMNPGELDFKEEVQYNCSRFYEK